MIRVLHVVTTMNRGGLETMLMNYYRNIDRSKVQFDFLMHRNDESDYEKEIIQMGGKIYRLPTLNPFSISYRKKLAKFFNEHHYDIVHSHIDCMSFLPLYYAKKAGIKVRIAHSHNANQDKNLKYLLKLFYKRKIYKVSTYLFACGKDAGDWMFGKHHYEILNNAIDVQEFIFSPEISKNVRNELGIENRFVVGHVGRFSEQKNHEFIVKIAKELVKINKNVVFLLVGEGHLEDKIKNQVKDLKISDNFLFYGKTNNVSQLMQGMDVFLFPSLYEGLPLTLVEAQASGLKCVISDSIPKDCILTKNILSMNLTKSPQEWAIAINNYADGYLRKDESSEITNAGFDVRKNAKYLEDFYVCQHTK